MDPLKRISELLDDATPRKRIAAAVVLGELQVKDPAVVSRLIAMAKDPVDAFAEAAVEALGAIRTMKALPVLLDALGRSRELERLASQAVAALGEDALPEIRARLAAATPETRVALSKLLPAVGGKASFEMALEGLRGQAWEAANPVALSLRQEARTMSPAEKRVMKTQVEKFLEKKKTLEDEVATRVALKMLGYLELPESEDTLLGFLSAKHPPLVRTEAATALRFALSQGASKKAMRKLMELLAGGEALVARAARDSLTVLPVGAEFAEELAELCVSPDVDVALWAINHLGALAKDSKLAVKTLLPVARSADRTRAEAAAKVVATLKGGTALLVEALADAEEEVGAQVLAEVLNPLAQTLDKKQVKALLAAAAARFKSSFAVAKRQLEPVRNADGAAWGELLREQAKAYAKKDPVKAEAISQLLGRSMVATPEDRFAFVVQQFAHHALDPHPRARLNDPALITLEKLHREGFKVSEAVLKAKGLSDEARYYVGVHFAEKSVFELKNLGAEVLEVLAGKGKGKLAKAAKNKMKLLGL
ncbi:MAG: HEAT repeat domain-containing protein [Myxococcaceae bacterium]|nr:HEAT repeat domain-containing protein [Myxococcaceae bacterium]